MRYSKKPNRKQTSQELQAEMHAIATFSQRTRLGLDFDWCLKRGNKTYAEVKKELDGIEASRTI